MFRMTGNGLHQRKRERKCIRVLQQLYQVSYPSDQGGQTETASASPTCRNSLDGGTTPLFFKCAFYQTHAARLLHVDTQAVKWVRELNRGPATKKKTFLTYSTRKQAVWLSGLGWHFRWHLKCTLIFAGELSELAKLLNVWVFRGDLPRESQTRVYHGLIE